MKRINLAVALAVASVGKQGRALEYSQPIREPAFLNMQSPYASFGREKQHWQGQGKRKKPKQN